MLSPFRLGPPLVTLCLALALAPGTRADDVAIDAFLPAPDQAGFTGFASTRTPGHLGVDTTLWLDYGLHTLEGREVGSVGMPVRHRVDGTLAAQLGLWTRASVALRLPFLLTQTGDAVAGVPEARAMGVGNPALDARVRLWGAAVAADGSVKDGAAVALRGVVQAPLSPTDSYMGDRFRTDLSAISDLSLFGVSMGAAFTYVHRQSSHPLVPAVARHGLRLDGGMFFPSPLLSRRKPAFKDGALVELGVGTDAEHFFARRRTPVEGRLGYRLTYADYSFTAVAGAGFNAALGNPDLRALAGFSWSPRTRDQDGDGILDRRDQCVHEPEDLDGFQDEDGCADDDNDGDMIVDADDRCPTEPAEWGRDEDEDGCTDP